MNGQSQVLTIVLLVAMAVAMSIVTQVFIQQQAQSLHKEHLGGPLIGDIYLRPDGNLCLVLKNPNDSTVDDNIQIFFKKGDEVIGSKELRVSVSGRSSKTYCFAPNVEENGEYEVRIAGAHIILLKRLEIEVRPPLPKIPNLYVSYIVLSAQPYKGSPVQVTAHVCNDGNASATTFVQFTMEGGFGTASFAHFAVSIPGGSPPTTDILNSTSKTVPAGNCVDYSVTWTPSEVGNYTITAFVDPLNEISESNESDNTETNTTTVRAVSLVFECNSCGSCTDALNNSVNYLPFVDENIEVRVTEDLNFTVTSVPGGGCIVVENPPHELNFEDKVYLLGNGHKIFATGGPAYSKDVISIGRAGPVFPVYGLHIENIEVNCTGVAGDITCLHIYAGSNIVVKDANFLGGRRDVMVERPTTDPIFCVNSFEDVTVTGGPFVYVNTDATLDGSTDPSLATVGEVIVCGDVDVNIQHLRVVGSNNNGIVILSSGTIRLLDVNLENVYSVVNSEGAPTLYLHSVQATGISGIRMPNGGAIFMDAVQLNTNEYTLDANGINDANILYSTLLGAYTTLSTTGTVRITSSEINQLQLYGDGNVYITDSNIYAYDPVAATAIYVEGPRVVLDRVRAVTNTHDALSIEEGNVTIDTTNGPSRFCAEENFAIYVSSAGTTGTGVVPTNNFNCVCGDYNVIYYPTTNCPDCCDCLQLAPDSTTCSSG